MRREPVPTPSGVDLDELGERIRYVGSSEHKTHPSFAGPPKLRADASRCDPSLGDPDELSGWLRDGLAAKAHGGPWEGGFPRYIWTRQDGVCYEGRLVNSGLGEYKGYPLVEDECPVGV